MAYNLERTAATYAKEILRTVNGSEIAENAVVDGTQVPLNADGRRILESGQVMIFSGVNETQVATVTGSPTGGSFTLTFGGSTTDPIAYNATAATVQARLEALDTLEVGDVSVTGSAGGPYTIVFSGNQAGRNVPALTKDNSGLTGGTSPNVTISTSVAGGTGAVKGQKVIPAPSSGITSDQVAGILMHTTEFWPGSPVANKTDAPVALWTQNCDFATPELLSYTSNATAVKAAMTGGGVGVGANCKFST